MNHAVSKYWRFKLEYISLNIKEGQDCGCQICCPYFTCRNVVFPYNNIGRLLCVRAREDLSWRQFWFEKMKTNPKINLEFAVIDLNYIFFSGLWEILSITWSRLVHCSASMWWNRWWKQAKRAVIHWGILHHILELWSFLYSASSGLQEYKISDQRQSIYLRGATNSSPASFCRRNCVLGCARKSGWNLSQ